MYCFGGYGSLYFSSGCYPEMEAEKLPDINTCYCRFGFNKEPRRKQRGILKKTL